MGPTVKRRKWENSEKRSKTATIGKKKAGLEHRNERNPAGFTRSMPVTKKELKEQGRNAGTKTQVPIRN